MAQGSVWENAIIWGALILLFVILITVIYNIMVTDNRLTEQDQILYDEIKATETKENAENDESYIQQLKDFFFSEDEEGVYNSEDYEERLYLEANEKQADIDDYTTILTNSPKLIFSIFGFGVTSDDAKLFFGFISGLVGLYLIYLGYQEVKAWLGR